MGIHWDIRYPMPVSNRSTPLPSTICVFCGSSPGARASYIDAACELGRLLAVRGVTLIYGGASVGLMGALADAALAAGGSVVGVMPKALVDREVSHSNLTQLHVVGSMHERKARMADLAEAFIALPGGFGTIEELFEILTWAQLGLHQKPIGLLNVEGYFDPLLSFVDRAVEERFLHAAHRGLVFDETTPEGVLRGVQVYEAPRAEKWLDRSET